MRDPPHMVLAIYFQSRTYDNFRGAGVVTSCDATGAQQNIQCWHVRFEVCAVVKATSSRVTSKRMLDVMIGGEYERPHYQCVCPIFRSQST